MKRLRQFNTWQYMLDRKNTADIYCQGSYRVGFRVLIAVGKKRFLKRDVFVGMDLLRLLEGIS